MYPALAGWVTVTLRTAAPTPLAGTPPRPVTCRVREPPAGTVAAGAPTPLRVSRIRTGAKGRYVAAVGEELSTTNDRSAVAVAPSASVARAVSVIGPSGSV